MSYLRKRPLFYLVETRRRYLNFRTSNVVSSGAENLHILVVHILLLQVVDMSPARPLSRITDYGIVAFAEASALSPGKKGSIAAYLYSMVRLTDALAHQTNNL